MKKRPPPLTGLPGVTHSEPAPTSPPRQQSAPEPQVAAPEPPAPTRPALEAMRQRHQDQRDLITARLRQNPDLGNLRQQHEEGARRLARIRELRAFASWSLSRVPNIDRAELQGCAPNTDPTDRSNYSYATPDEPFAGSKFNMDHKPFDDWKLIPSDERKRDNTVFEIRDEADRPFTFRFQPGDVDPLAGANLYGLDELLETVERVAKTEGAERNEQAKLLAFSRLRFLTWAAIKTIGGVAGHNGSYRILDVNLSTGAVRFGLGQACGMCKGSVADVDKMSAELSKAWAEYQDVRWLNPDAVQGVVLSPESLEQAQAWTRAGLAGQTQVGSHGGIDFEPTM